MSNKVGACNAGVVFFFGLQFAVIYAILNLIGIYRRSQDETKGKTLIGFSMMVAIFPFLFMLSEETSFAAMIMVFCVLLSFVQIVVSPSD